MVQASTELEGEFGSELWARVGGHAYESWLELHGEQGQIGDAKAKAVV